MPPTIACGHCQKTFTPPTGTPPGGEIRCPFCRGRLRAGGRPPAPVVAEEPTPQVEEIADEVAAPEPVRVAVSVKDKPRRRRADGQGGIRGTVVLCGLLAAAACGIVGYFWYDEQVKLKPLAPLMVLLTSGDESGKAAFSAFAAQGQAYPLLFTAAAAGLLGAFCAVRRYGVAGGLVMLLAVVGLVGPAWGHRPGRRWARLVMLLAVVGLVGGSVHLVPFTRGGPW